MGDREATQIASLSNREVWLFFCQPQPMPRSVYAYNAWFKRKGYTWHDLIRIYSELTQRERREALEYLIGMFPDLTILSSHAQIYAHGMSGIEALYD